MTILPNLVGATLVDILKNGPFFSIFLGQKEMYLVYVTHITEKSHWIYMLSSGLKGEKVY
jgi:hypothetical protein